MTSSVIAPTSRQWRQTQFCPKRINTFGEWNPRVRKPAELNCQLTLPKPDCATSQPGGNADGESQLMNVFKPANLNHAVQDAKTHEPGRSFGSSRREKTCDVAKSPAPDALREYAIRITQDKDVVQNHDDWRQTGQA